MIKEKQNEHINRNHVRHRRQGGPGSGEIERATENAATQTLEKMHTGSAALWSGFWGLLIGLLFLAPIFWGLFGALMGYLFSKGTDLGIDNKFIKDVGDSLDPGQSALFILVVEATQDKVLPEMAEFGGTVFQTSLSNEDEEMLKKALEHEDVSAAAQESLAEELK
jgi:uncharacterized membrane protein